MKPPSMLSSQLASSSRDMFSLVIPRWTRDRWFKIDVVSDELLNGARCFDTRRYLGVTSLIPKSDIRAMTLMKLITCGQNLQKLETTLPSACPPPTTTFSLLESFVSALLQPPHPMKLLYQVFLKRRNSRDTHSGFFVFYKISAALVNFFSFRPRMRIALTMSWKQLTNLSASLSLSIEV